MEIEIKDLKDVVINGVRFSFKENYNIYKENFFEWVGFPLVSSFKTNNIMAGLLQGWHHTPEFDLIEYHEDKELFYFFQGTSLMLFVDINNGEPVMETVQIVRIPAGTELEIAQGKGHFVPVAEDEKLNAIVISPVQEAPRLRLVEKVIGKWL